MRCMFYTKFVWIYRKYEIVFKIKNLVYWTYWFYFSTSEDKEKQYTSQTTRLLALLDALASHKACKLAILHLINGTIKGDERYAEIFQDLLALVRSPGDSVTRQQCVEYVTSILQSLCDQVFIAFIVIVCVGVTPV